MKRIDLILQLRAHSCVLIREGGNYSFYYNPQANRTGAVPCHREISDQVANL